MCLKKRKHEVAISDLQMKLESVKKHHDNRLKQIEDRFDGRLNQIENRFAHLESHQNRPASREGHDNDDDRYYSCDNMQWIDDSGSDPQDY